MVKVFPPRRRTSLGTLSRQAKEISDKIKKYKLDMGMNIDAGKRVDNFLLETQIEYFNSQSEKLNELYQEQCKQKGR